MATYIYETIDEPHVRFEIKQSMKDEALTHHPESGVPVRRVISGGYGMIVKSAPAMGPCGEPCAEPQGCCSGGGCCAHAH